MGTSRQITESQLTEARHALKLRSEKLAADGIEPDKMKRDPKWRHLSAQARKIVGRLKKLSEVEALDAELAQRRAEKLAGEPAEA